LRSLDYFVTAMMALFIILWLMSSSKEIQEAVGGCFRDPSGQSGMAVAAGAAPAADPQVGTDDMERLKDTISSQLQHLAQAELLADQVEMRVIKEGLRVELLETAAGMFFDSGNSIPNGQGKDLLIMLAQQLGKLPNRLPIEGRTDSKPFTGRAQYSNWELSADRANAARSIMEGAGLRPGRVSQVRGFADRLLRSPDEPLDPANRRISVIVLNQLDAAGEADNAGRHQPSAGPPR